jgi:hypothetical protein
MPVAILICTLVFGAGAAGTDGNVDFLGNIHPLNITPTFDHGFLAVYENGNGIAVYKPDGSLEMRVAAPQHAGMVNADIDSDGSVATAVEWYDRRRSGVRFFNPNGEPASQIDTGLYVPSQV